MLYFFIVMLLCWIVDTEFVKEWLNGDVDFVKGWFNGDAEFVKV